MEVVKQLRQQLDDQASQLIERGVKPYDAYLSVYQIAELLKSFLLSIGRNEWKQIWKMSHYFNTKAGFALEAAPNATYAFNQAINFPLAAGIAQSEADKPGNAKKNSVKENPMKPEYILEVECEHGRCCLLYSSAEARAAGKAFMQKYIRYTRFNFTEMDQQEAQNEEVQAA